MEILPFIKNLIIDSLAGISFRNLPFILLQLVSAPLAILLSLNLLKVKTEKGKTILFGVAFTLLFIIASTSVPLAILAGFIVLAFLIYSKKKNVDSCFILLIFSFSAGSGHLVLVLLSIIVIVLFSFFTKRVKND